MNSQKNGAALAALLSAGIGALAMGVFVIANEAGIYAAPSLFGPAGGLSGRAAFAVIAWVVAWGVLHARWQDRDVNAARVFAWSLVLTALGIVAVFPPVWGLLGS